MRRALLDSRKRLERCGRLESGIVGDVEAPIVMELAGVRGLQVSIGDGEEACDFFGACLVRS